VVKKQSKKRNQLIRSTTNENTIETSSNLLTQRYSKEKSMTLRSSSNIRNNRKIAERQKKEKFNFIEEFLFFESHKLLGHKWTNIKRYFPKVSENNIKNHFYCYLRKVTKQLLKDKIVTKRLKDNYVYLNIIIYIKELFIDIDNSKEKASETNLNKDKAINNVVNVVNNMEFKQIEKIYAKFKGDTKRLDYYIKAIGNRIIMILKIKNKYEKAENSERNLCDNINIDTNENKENQSDELSCIFRNIIDYIQGKLFKVYLSKFKEKSIEIKEISKESIGSIETEDPKEDKDLLTKIFFNKYVKRLKYSYNE